MERIFETERLIMRPLALIDAADIAEKINVYEISKNLARVPFPYALADAVEFLAWVKTLDAKSVFRAILAKDNPNELIGVVSVEWNETKQDGEIGYWLVESHWGQGLMTEAVDAIVAEAFQNRGIEKIVSCFFNENPASGKVLAKAGFAVTGTSKFFSKAQNCDVGTTLVQLTKQRWHELEQSTGKKLETQRLLLRPPTLGDETALVAALNNFKISQMTGRIPFPYTKVDATTFIQSCASSEDQWRFIVFEKATNNLVGGVGIRGQELGYWIAEPYWGQGFASEAATAVLSDLFKTGKQKAIAARWRIDNPASGRVLEKLGFERTGFGTCKSKATDEDHPSIEAILTLQRWRENKKAAV